MSLRNILARLRNAGQNTLDLAMTVEARPSSLVHKDFREFTAPMRQQRGGAIRLALTRVTGCAESGLSRIWEEMSREWDADARSPGPGTGAVGQGVVGALLEAGSPVLVVGRDPGRLAALHEQFADEPGLETLLGSLSDDGSARRWPNASRSARVRWRR
jgi:hypothetical protein